jgi:hypothetical protein
MRRLKEMSAMETDPDGPVPFDKIEWHLQRSGRRWSLAEVRKRYELSPEKIELIEGKLFWSERDRLVMLGLLLENVGVDRAVRLGDATVWKEAIAHLDEPIEMIPENDL